MRTSIRRTLHLSLALLAGLAAAAPARAQDHLVVTPTAPGALAGSALVLEVQAVDAGGSPVLAEVLFSLEATGSAGGLPVFSGSGQATTTERTSPATGLATVTVTDTTAERVTVSVQSASAGGTPLPVAAPHEDGIFDVFAGAADHVIVAGDAQVRAGEEASLFLQVTDAHDNPTGGAVAVCVEATGSAGGAPVLTPDDGDGDPSRSCLTTDAASGWSPLSVHDAQAETVTLCVTSTGLPGSAPCEHSAALAVTGGAADHLVLTAPAQAAACDAVQVDLQVVDVDGNAVAPVGGAGVPVTLRVSAPAGAPGITATTLSDPFPDTLPAAQVTGRTAPDGSASVTVSLDAAATLTVAWASTSLPGDPAGTSAQVAFVPGPADPAASTLAADTTQVTAGVGAATLTVTPRDACGVDLGPGLADVVIDVAAGGVGAVAPRPADDRGDGTYQAVFTAPAGTCPGDAAVIEAAVGAVTLDATVALDVTCQRPDPASPVEVLDPEVPACAAAADPVFAEVRVTPVDDAGAPLLPGRAVTLVDPPATLVLGEVREETDAGTGGPAYVLPVGSVRCGWRAAAGRVEPTPVRLAVDGVELATAAVITFSCPEVTAEGLSFAAAPAQVPADGISATQVTVTVTDVCGGPVFGRPVTLSATEGGAPLLLPDLARAPLTVDAFGEPADGTVRLSVRSETAGFTGVRAEVELVGHDPAVVGADAPADLILFTPEEVVGLTYAADIRAGVVGQDVGLTLTLVNLTEAAVEDVRVSSEQRGLVWGEVTDGPARLQDGALVLDGPLAGGASVTLTLAGRLGSEKGGAWSRAVARYVSALLPEAELESASAPVRIGIGGHPQPAGCECGSAGGGAGSVPWLAALAAAVISRRRWRRRA